MYPKGRWSLGRPVSLGIISFYPKEPLGGGGLDVGKCCSKALTRVVQTRMRFMEGQPAPLSPKSTKSK
jgi:hypothetical protein